jgi:hypothetical protein
MLSSIACHSVSAPSDLVLATLRNAASYFSHLYLLAFLNNNLVRHITPNTHVLYNTTDVMEGVFITLP